MSHQERRGIAVGDSEVVQIGDYVGRLGEGETPIELKTIS
jgi:hypothetical protein